MAEREGKANNLGFDRIVFFSDAIVAIAITLLVLPLVDSVPDHGTFKAGALIADDSSLLLAFAISFWVIARFWLVHHRLFTRIQAYTPALVRVNMAWLLSIVWLPFPTEMIGVQDETDAVVRGVYIGSLLVTSLCLVALELVVVRTPALWADPEDSGVDVTGAVSAVIAFAVALVLAVAVPAIGMWALLLLFVAPRCVRVVERRRTAVRERRRADMM